VSELTISIDATGGDHGTSVTVPGVAAAAKQYPNVRFLLHGDRAAIEAELARHEHARAVCEIRHTDKAVAMDEKPSVAMRRGKGSSMWNAIEAVKTGEATAAVSAGNTGALMAISMLLLRMAADVHRPAIVASWPTMRGITAVLDVGANVESDAAQLVEFAIMGAAFHHALYGSEHPTVGLLNVGSEDQKGHEEVREAHGLLRDTHFNLDYRGFVEGDDISKGTVDVIVTDGFTGNVTLKAAEGLARTFSAKCMPRWIMKSTPSPITSTPKAIESGLSSPTVTAAKAADQTKPTIKVSAAATTRRNERKARASTSTTRKKDNRPATSVSLARPRISSSLRAG